MATISGSLTSDFIHLSGDGLVAPPGANDLALATSGPDEILARDGNDTIYAGAGNDTLQGGGGADQMFGGLGDDLYFVDNLADGVVEAAGAGNDTVIASVSLTLAAEVEHLQLLGNIGLTAIGNGLNNSITGTWGADTLDGGAGADTLEGLKGGDRYIVDNVNDVVIEKANSGWDRVISSVSLTLAANVEALFLDSKTGLSGTGNDMNNALYGNLGNDTLDGGLGIDTMSGGSGNDVYVVDNTLDVIVERAGYDTVLASANFTLGDGIEALTLTGAGLSGTGNALDNLMTGSSGNDWLDAGAGNDTLIGGTGVDTIYGGAGTDLIKVLGLEAGEIIGGGGGYDRLRLLDAGTAADLSASTLTGIESLISDRADVTMTTAQLDAFTGYVSADHIHLSSGGVADLRNLGLSDSFIYLSDQGTTLSLFTGGGSGSTDGNFSGRVYGGAGADSVTVSGTTASGIFLYGGAGDDQLTAGRGADELTGGAGSDTMTGGLGRDTYYISAADAGSTDYITDFAHSDYGDVLIFSTEESWLSEIVYIGSKTFAEQLAAPRYDYYGEMVDGGHPLARYAGGGMLQFDFDGDGISDYQIQIATLTGEGQMERVNFGWSD